MADLEEACVQIAPHVWDALGDEWFSSICPKERVLFVRTHSRGSPRVLLATEAEVQELEPWTINRPNRITPVIQNRLDWIERKYANGGPLVIQTSMVEVVVTPDMERAGAEELRMYRPMYDGDMRTAAAIYRAMELARRQSLGGTS